MALEKQALMDCLLHLALINKSSSGADEETTRAPPKTQTTNHVIRPCRWSDCPLLPTLWWICEKKEHLPDLVLIQYIP